MFLSRVLLIILPIFALLLIASPVKAADRHTRLLVKFQGGVDKHEIMRRDNSELKTELPKLGVTVVDSHDDLDTARRKYRREQVEYVEEDSIASALDSNDVMYNQQWALPKIFWNQLDASSSALNSTSLTKIAIVDTGVDYTHPDLAGKVDTADGWDFVNNDSDAMDDNIHGTHVAGIAVADTNNSLGIAGVSFNTTQVIPVKVLDKNGSGYYSWVASGIIWATDHGAKAINLSLGGSTPSTTLQNAVNYAWGKGVVIAAAAGNSGNTGRLYPAYYNNVMAVWASDQNSKKAPFSSYGNWVDIGAPGVSILSTIPGGYSLLSGTSMATPEVTGLAGLLFSEHPAWTNSQIRNKIESTATSVADRNFTRGLLGKGIINIFKATQ